VAAAALFVAGVLSTYWYLRAGSERPPAVARVEATASATPVPTPGPPTPAPPATPTPTPRQPTPAPPAAEPEADLPSPPSSEAARPDALAPLPETPEPEAPAAPPPVPVAGPTDAGSAAVGEPARLSIDFEHHLKSGMLRVWVDQVLEIEEPLHPESTRKIVVFKLRKGSVEESLELAPGRHDIGVQVAWDDNTRGKRVSGDFAPGQGRTLKIRVQRITNRLSVDLE
jgi:hypothetical protein